MMLLERLLLELPLWMIRWWLAMLLMRMRTMLLLLLLTYMCVCAA